MALTQEQKNDLEKFLSEMTEDFADIRAKNDGEDLKQALSAVDFNVESSRYLVRRAYELYPDCANRIPVYLAMHTSKMLAARLADILVRDGVTAFWHALSGQLVAPLYTSLWENMEDEIVEDELSRL